MVLEERGDLVAKGEQPGRGNKGKIKSCCNQWMKLIRSREHSSAPGLSEELFLGRHKDMGIFEIHHLAPAGG